MTCKVTKGVIKPCKGMDAVLEMDGGNGSRRQGAKLQTLINTKSMKFSRQWIVLKSGKYAKTGVVMNYCPFCRAEIFKDREDTKNSPSAKAA